MTTLKQKRDSNVGVRVEGVMSALSLLTGDNTNGAFWGNATSQKNAKNPGLNWTQYDKKNTQGLRKKEEQPSLNTIQINRRIQNIIKTFGHEKIAVYFTYCVWHVV